MAAGALCTLTLWRRFSARLGWAWEPRKVTPGKSPVTEIAGVDQRLIGWQSTRRQQIRRPIPRLSRCRPSGPARVREAGARQ
ncbi:relaxase domain-containing protein [Streptomyces sp. NBC_01724]|uniref:relaxase domain-containing protein n=1 Tax=unclassified Streptomyces TaxID=2593676 RepID=UPI002ED3E707|nr:relaxase domain-containing protein [Streptomyces sp. NBC_01620]WTE57361.1 relaxase domain-containing protein [Streptomyces sp. NBC_01617]WTE64767.1 relaxase domain-containing protein [Streptomyces sp. NBC_01617]WTI92175.1 relaxase domain-containing protein [Streptomyces sp. NBC_00724]WTI92696.1 relaxase domain-containing protein [Streptomyces sp. NBC_00724]